MRTCDNLIVKRTFFELDSTGASQHLLKEEVVQRRTRAFTDSALAPNSGQVCATPEDFVDDDASSTEEGSLLRSSDENETSDARQATEDCYTRSHLVNQQGCHLLGGMPSFFCMPIAPGGSQMFVPMSPMWGAGSVEMPPWQGSVGHHPRAGQKFDARQTARSARRVRGGKRSHMEQTTLMIKNLPNNYMRSTLLELLNDEGFTGLYNFVYLPIDFRNFAGFGYGFVNFCTHVDAVKAQGHFNGFDRWTIGSRKVCEAVWSSPVQGLDAHIERYRSSPIMHESVPDEYKPIVFVDGIRVPFPAPSKRIRVPRFRLNGEPRSAGS